MATYEPVDTLELYARDELPETFDALTESRKFGPAALGRRKNRVMWSIWGRLLDTDQQEVLAEPVKTYAGKLIAKSLIGPGIDYWSQQVVSQAAGTTEQVSYGDRVRALADLDKRLTAELAELLIEIEPITPPVRTVVGSAPHVQQAGKLETTNPGTLYTPDPYDLPPAYGPPDVTPT
jgi:hypothetical protein